jgi:hypothetical protein
MEYLTWAALWWVSSRLGVAPLGRKRTAPARLQREGGNATAWPCSSAPSSHPTQLHLPTGDFHGTVSLKRPSTSSSGRPDHTVGPPQSFDDELCALVVDLAPRLFAVIQERGPGTGDGDGWVAAWGVAYEDGHAEVISLDGSQRFSLGSAERAVWWFGRRAGITARLVWLAPPTAASFHRTEAA